MNKTVILAYSGGLDTSTIIPWLIKEKKLEVVAYCANLGNGPNRKQLEEKAKRSGAIEFVYEDLKDKFSQDFVFPIIRAGAVYEEEYLLGTAIARPHF